MVLIADREADQFQILYDCHNRGHSFVIRSKHDRMIQGEDHYLSCHLNKKKVLLEAFKEQIESLETCDELKITFEKMLETHRSLESIELNLEATINTHQDKIQAAKDKAYIERQAALRNLLIGE